MSAGLILPDGGVARSLTRVVFESMRAKILTGHLKPGEKLSIAVLTRQFGVSLSAVREGLARLTSEGWVESEDQRGFRVRGVSIEDLHDVTTARIEIEAAALRRSIEHGDAAWEAELQTAFGQLQAATPRRSASRSGTAGWARAHRRFHVALLAACGSTRLLQFQQLLFEQSERYRVLSGIVIAESRDVESEHQRIYDAAMARDATAAVAALREHFLLTASILNAARFAAQSPLGKEIER
ncbi:MAG: FCD domain-containing protein [Rhodospirillales bacterium]|nr:FCD domain-containing protein [Rhodospirillales bacterium]